MRTRGGNGADVGGCTALSFSNIAHSRGLAVAPEFDLVLFAMTFTSSNMVGVVVTNPGTPNVVVPVYSRNGTFLKYLLDYIDNTYHFPRDAVYSNTAKNFYFSTLMRSSIWSIYQISASNLTSTLLWQDARIECITLTVTPDNLVCAGATSYSVYAPVRGNSEAIAYRYTIDNLTFVQGI